jgi:hypothetical protein
VQQGTPLYVLKELGAWETLEIVDYADRSVSFRAQRQHKYGTTTKRPPAEAAA